MELTKKQATACASAAKKLLAVIMANMKARPDTMLWLFAPCALRGFWAGKRLNLAVPGDRPVDPVELAGEWAALYAPEVSDTRTEAADWIVNRCAQAATEGDRAWSENVSWGCALPADLPVELAADPAALLDALEKMGHRGIRERWMNPAAANVAGPADPVLCAPVEIREYRTMRRDHCETRRLRTEALPLFTVQTVLAHARNGRINLLADLIRAKAREAIANGLYETVEMEETTEADAEPTVAAATMLDGPDWTKMAVALVEQAKLAQKGTA